MLPQIFRMESRDFLEMEHALSAWDHQYRQVGSGKFHGSLLHTQIGSSGIFRNCWEQAIHYRGTAPEETLAFGLTLSQSCEARWLGQRVNSDDLLIQRCGLEAEYFSAPFWEV